MRIILGTIAAAAVLVGVAAQPAEAARCWWSGYAWVCHQHERFVDRDRFDRDRFDRSDRFNAERFIHRFVDRDRFDRDRFDRDRFNRQQDFYSGGERRERRNWQWGY